MSLKCGVCGGPAASGGPQVGYVRTVGDVVVGAQAFCLCSRCARRAVKNPKRVVRGLRRAYNAGLN